MSYLGLQESGLPALIVDVLETWAGDWFTVEGLGAVVDEHRADQYSSGTIERSVLRLAAAGKVERRITPRTWPPRHDVLEIRRTGREYLHQIA